MNKLYIVANWKSNKTKKQSVAWLDDLAKIKWDTHTKEVILCPSFPLLPILKDRIDSLSLPIILGLQNVSTFTEGAYTGEVAASQITDFVRYGIVGHSERRKYFHETDDDVISKVERLLGSDITPILCVSDMKQLDYYLAKGSVIVENASKIIFVYEPPSAISGGGAFHPENPETANKNAVLISEKIGRRVITLYGGSINSDNAATFFSSGNIDGGLVGQASLDSKTFYDIIQTL